MGESLGLRELLSLHSLFPGIQNPKCTPASAQEGASGGRVEGTLLWRGTLGHLPPSPFWMHGLSCLSWGLSLVPEAAQGVRVSLDSVI